LQSYYDTLLKLTPSQKTDAVYKEAEENAFVVLAAYLAKADLFSAEMILKLRHVLVRYFERARITQHQWVVLQVEQFYELPLVEDFTYACRLDLLVLIDGLVTIVDHKFVYNFWSQDDLDLNPQLPKYAGILRNHGVRVDRIMVNQIRYRVRRSSPYEDDEMFRESFSPATEPLVRNHLREQILISRKIIEHRGLPVEERGLNSTRVLNPMVCRSCSVKSLCIQALQGVDIKNEIAASYQPNTYDYNLYEETAVSY